MKNENIIMPEARRVEIVDRPMPAIGPEDVLVRLVRSTVSNGTERANYLGEVNVNILTNDGIARWPRQGGYSASGVVEAVGERVRSVRVGERVATSWSVHARFVALPEDRVYRIPDGVSFEVAALAHIATFPMAAIRKCRLELGESAIVFGQGVLGQLAVLLLRAAGATPVIAADLDAAKCRRALELGADVALNPAEPDFAARVRALCPGRDSAVFKNGTAGGARVAIEVTGSGAALNAALDVMAFMGRVALLGCTRQSDFSVDYYHKVHGRGVTLIGAHTWMRPEFESYSGHFTHRDDAQAFLNLVACGRLDLSGFVAEVHPITAASEIYRRLGESKSFPTVQFDWEK